MTNEIQSFIQRSGDSLLDEKGVVSVGRGVDESGNEQLVVSVKSKSHTVQDFDARLQAIIPQGMNYRVEEKGEIVPEVVSQATNRKIEHRPIPQGVSIGHFNITAGTSGSLYETDDGTVYLASNNHVLANSNQASEGDAIIQPGPHDGSYTLPDDRAGGLAYYTPVENNVSVDLAIMEPEVGVSNNVLDIDDPVVGAERNVSPGDELVKSGRTTQVRFGTVEQVDVSVNVNYGDELGTVTVTGCIMTESMSEGGDSGSSTYIRKSDGLYLVGRLFAGSSDVTVHHAVGNEIDILQSEFDSSISLVTEDGGGGNGGGDEPDLPTAEVTLQLTQESPDTGNIAVTVNDGGGNPVNDAQVVISGASSGTRRTSSDGTATFQEVPVGDYTIEASKTGYTASSTSISSGDFQ